MADVKHLYSNEISYTKTGFCALRIINIKKSGLPKDTEGLFRCVLSTPTASSSSHSHESSSYDNMRGFDPASEDDMEDNGMSRYMENNDEEGWD